MPNHVINRLTFDCPEDRLRQILSEIWVPKNKPCKRITHTAASRLGKQPNKATLRSDLDASRG